jgi:enamine deaminase RidA (YjgF/YER057c/UK114 family)
VGDTVAVTGCVGTEVSLEQAREGARLCTLRALAVLRQALGTLDRVERILKLQVFVHSDADFAQHSNVADAASDLLVELFGPHGRAARTAVGVRQLPQRASVEIDLIVAAPAAVTSSQESLHAIPR